MAAAEWSALEVALPFLAGAHLWRGGSESLKDGIYNISVRIEEMQGPKGIPAGSGCGRMFLLGGGGGAKTQWKF